MRRYRRSSLIGSFRPVSVLTFVVAAALAGGICGLSRVEISVEGSHVVGNAAGSKGGGIFVQESTLRVADTTVADNTAGASGGKQPRSYPECRRRL